MITIIPVQDVETTIRPNLQRHRHAPRIVRDEEIGLAFSQVSRAVALQPIHIERAAMNVANDNALAVLRRIRVRVEKCQAAISGLLMTVVRDRADRNGERRKRARLPLVMTGLDEMEQMIVRPMTRFDNRAAVGVPRQAVGIARTLADDLEFARARMHSPKRAVEFVFPAVVRANEALIEHAVQSIEPAVRSPGQRVRKLVRIRAAKAREHHFAADLPAILLAQEEKVRRVEHPDAAVTDLHARGNVQSLGKGLDLVSVSIRVRIFENFYAITTNTCRLPWILDALSNPDAPAIIERHRDGIHDVRFTRDQFDGEALGHRHFADGLLR